MNRDQLSDFLMARAVAPMFTIAVLSGSAVVQAQQRVELRTGQVHQVQQPSPPSPQELADVRALWPAVVDTGDAAAERFAELAYRLRVQPGLYEAVRADLQSLAGDALTSDGAFARSVQLLVFDPAGDSLELAARLLSGVRPLRDPDVLLRLSERGLVAARRALREQIATVEPDDGEMYAVAAHLAANSMPPAPELRQLLQAALPHEKGLEPVVLVRVMVAALGLRALGEEAPLRALWRELGPAVEEALANDATEDAARLVAIADWFTTHGIDGTSGSLAWLRDDFLPTWAQHQFAQQLGDATRIRARLAAITPK